MKEIKENINDISTNCNSIVAKLEILRALEEHKENLSVEIKKTKDKLEKEEITKFTYATLQEVNQKNLDYNISQRKIVWNEIAEMINTVSDKLNLLKDLYNKKSELDESQEIKEEEEKEE